MDSYGLILTNVFQDNNNLKWKWELYDRESGDSNVNIDAGESPAVYNWESGGADLMPHGVVIAGSMDVQLIATTASQYTSYMGTDDKRYALKFYYYNGASYDEVWRGYHIPSYYSKTWGNPPLTVNLKFSDLLGDLQNIPYATDEKLLSDPTFYGSMKSHLDIICFCLRELDTDINSVKVAINLFSQLYHNQASTDSPLAQTYLDTDTFFTTKYSTALVEEVDTTYNMEEVMNLLMPYGASIIQWEGSYWIIDLQAWEIDTTFAYVEYDINGTYVTNSTQANIYDFDTATSSSRWRWMGTQTVTATSTYKSVDLELEGQVVESLTPAFNRENAFFLSFFPFSGTWNLLGADGGKPSITTTKGNECDLYLYDSLGRTLTPNNLNSSYYATIPTVDKDLVSPNEPLVYGISVKDQVNSTTYITVTDSSSFENTDKCIIDVEYKVSEILTGRSFRGKDRRGERRGARYGLDRGGSGSVSDQAYLTLKWQWQVGSYYYNNQEGSWSASEQINQEFITNFNQTQNLKAEVPFRSGDYTLKVWAVSPSEADYIRSNETDLEDAVRAINTSALDAGTRIVGRTDYTSAGGDPESKLYFYELDVVDTGSGVLTPNTYYGRRWVLRDTKIVTNTTEVATEFAKFDIIPLPLGEEVEETPVLSRLSNVNNNHVLTTSLPYFDYPDFINNSENLYKNILRANSGITYPGITDWINNVGDEHKIQTHYHNRLLRLANESRWKIQGEATYNSKPSPIVAYRVPNDDNRRFLAQSGSMDFKNNTINADFVELINDGTPTIGGHEKASHSTGHS